MKITKPIFYLFLLFAFSFKANNDSLVKFSELVFKNGSEKEFFQNFTSQNQKKDIIDLMLMSYNRDNFFSSVKAHLLINLFVSDLMQQTKGLSNAKKVKAVYKAVHREFLRVYKMQNSFSDIFERGEYNCVSSTALFAIVLDKMNIPFRIQEQPQHVYITAFPQQEAILIETTSPENGYLQISPALVQKYNKYLLNSKLITKEEYDNEPPDSIFAKHYYTSAGIDFEHMPGIQYANYALYYADNSQFDLALQEIKKAYVVDPSLRNKYLLRYLLLYQTSNNNYKTDTHLKELLCLCRFHNNKDPEITNQYLRNEFLRLMNDVLIANSDEPKTKEAFDVMTNCLQDSSVKAEITFEYHYELARLALFNRTDKPSTFDHMKTAYQINPKHVNLQGIISNRLILDLEQNEQPENNIKLLEAYANEFDYLKDNDQYVILKATCVLDLIYRNFYLKNANEGEAYLQVFTQIMKSKKDIYPKEIAVERAFSEAAAYYYTKGNVNKTKSLLKTGLIYAPNNFGLQMRLMQVR